MSIFGSGGISIGGDSSTVSANKGAFSTLSELQNLYPSPENGWMATVGAKIYIGNGGAWALNESGGVSSEPNFVPFSNQNSIIVTHNKGYMPLVQVIDETGEMITDGVDIDYDSMSRFTVSANENISGTIIYK